jgi:putative flippase GtrA
MGWDVSRWGMGIITFLVNTVVIFFVTYGIEGGHVPLGASLLAALIIAALSNFVSFGRLKTT